jgi:hypothetical protein
MAKVYDNATDLITFARSSSGTALRRVGYGENLVDNDGFDTDLTGWATSNAWSVINGEAVGADTTSGNNFLRWLTGAEAGKVYLGSVDVKLNDGVGSTYLQWGGDINTRVTSPTAGTYTKVFFCSDGVELFRANVNGTNTNFIIDNVSVREVIFDRATDDLVLFNHPDDTPRIEYGSDGALKGLLIEELRANLVTSSADISGGNWFSNGGIITESAVLAPDGTQTGSTYDTDGAYRILRNVVSVSTGSTYTWSFYAKNIDATDVRYRVYDNTQATDIVSATSYFSQINTSDWTRISVTFTVPAGCSAVGVYLTSGTNGGTVAFWGAQLEEGSFPTSYIPTSGSQSTRSADVASIPVSAFGYNQDAGTVVVEGTRLHDAGSLSYASLNDGSGINRFTLYIQSTEKVNGYAFGNGGALTLNGPTISPPTSTTWGMSYAKIPTGGRYELAVDGAIYDNSDSIYGEFSGKTQLSIGSAWGYSEFANGHIKSLSYFPRRLTDAQLQELTS